MTHDMRDTGHRMLLICKY